MKKSLIKFIVAVAGCGLAVCGWADAVQGRISVEVTKTVAWSEGPDAIIAIDVHSTPEVRVKTPNVLMLGSLCYKHGLTPAIVKRALDTLAQVANVDYDFFLQVSSPNDADLTRPAYSGHLEKGATATGVPTTDYSNMHGALYAFYEYLDRARISGKDYDYIVLSFDRSRIATTFPGAHPHEAEVSQYIKTFYDRRAVVWMVDDEPANCVTLRAPRATSSTARIVNLTQTPWVPSPLVCLTSGNNHYWTTLAGYINYGNGSSVSGESAVVNYKALMGLFSPDHYANATTVYNRNVINTGSDGVATCIAKYNNAKGTANPNQVIYDNAENVAKMLKDIVDPTVATLRLEDHVCLEKGLKITSTEGYWTTKATLKAADWPSAQKNWTRLRADELTHSDVEGVQIAVSNVTTEAWLKLRIAVTDTGRFRSREDATYNEQTGLWEKDPNDGPVRVAMVSEAGRILAEDQASTAVGWPFEVKVQARALWIVDHEDPGDGYVYLAFEPELLDRSEGNAWVARFAEQGKLKVKYGRTRAEADDCQPVAAVLSDKPGHEPQEEKVWLKVALRDVVRSGETVVDPQGYWRIVIDGPARHLTGAEEDFGYASEPNGPQLQGVPLPDSVAGVIGTNGAVSVNTFGILKVAVPTTNTMVAVPWTWYSKIQRTAEDIPVKKLLKTTNLEVGDMVYTPIDNDTYAAWMVERDEVTGTNGTVYTNAVWSAVQVVRVDGDGYGRMQFRKDDDAGEAGYAKSTRIARGRGLWLYRQKPLDEAGNIRPIWLYGQSVTTEVTTVVSAPKGTNTVQSTLLGNPYAEDVVLNRLVFAGTIDPGDRIKIHVADGLNRDLVYVSGKGWREYVTRVVNGVKQSGYTYQTVIPAGTAFWYDRRGKDDLTITWPLSQTVRRDSE